MFKFHKFLVISSAAIALSLGAMSSASAASAETAGMPQFNGEFVAKTSNGLTALEKLPASKSHGLLGAYIGGLDGFKVDGDHSAVHLPTDQPVFYLKDDSGNDPSSEVTIYRLKSGRNQRTTNAKDSVPFSVTKKGPGIVEVRPTDSLAPGQEYGIAFHHSDGSLAQAMTDYTFPMYLFSISQ